MSIHRGMVDILEKYGTDSINWPDEVTERLDVTVATDADNVMSALHEQIAKQIDSETLSEIIDESI